jgi:hypothetical protein
MAKFSLHGTERNFERDLPWKVLWKRNVLVLDGLVDIVQYKIDYPLLGVKGM